MAPTKKSSLASRAPGGIVDLSKIKQADRKDVEAIISDIDGAYERIQRAGRRYINLGDDTKTKLRELTTPAQSHIWDSLEQVGLGQLHPKLVLAQGTGAKWLSQLPIDEQTKYLEERIPVALSDGDSLMVDVEEMSLDQRKQVFAKSGTQVKVRSLSEQKVWLTQEREREKQRQEKAAQQTSIDRPGRWTIKNRRAYIDPDKAAEGLTPKEVQQLNRDMKLS